MAMAPWILPLGIWAVTVIGKSFEGTTSTIKVLTHGPLKQTGCQPRVVKNSGPHPTPTMCSQSRVLPTGSLTHLFSGSLE